MDDSNLSCNGIWWCLDLDELACDGEGDSSRIGLPDDGLCDDSRVVSVP